MAADEILGARKQEDRLDAKRNQIKKSFPESRFEISRVKPRDVEQVKNTIKSKRFNFIGKIINEYGS